MLQTGVLGPLQAEVHGAPCRSGLLVGQGSSVSVDRLLMDLHEGAPPPTAHRPPPSALSGLQAYVSHAPPAR